VRYNNNNNNNNNNNQDEIYSAIIYGKVIAIVQSGHLNECGLAQGAAY